MTILVAHQNDHSAMLFGDAMIIGNESDSFTSVLPVVGPITNIFPKGSGYTVTGLRQKICVVSDECVIGWADNMLGAHMALTQLQELAAREKLNPDIVSWFLRNLNSDTVSLGTSLLGYVVGSKGPEFFSNGKHPDPLAIDGAKVIVEGTSTDYMGSFLQSSKRTDRNADANWSHEDIAREFGLQLATYHLAGESAGYAQFRRFFGGAYEVATYGGGRFSKCEDAAFVFWKGHRKPTYPPAYPSMVLTTSYREEDLLVLIQAFTEPPWRHDGQVQGRLSVIRPVHAARTKMKPILPSQLPHKPKWICHHFVYQNRLGGLSRMAMVQRLRNDGTDTLAIKYRNGQIVAIDYQGAFWKEVDAAFARGREHVGRQPNAASG